MVLLYKLLLIRILNDIRRGGRVCGLLKCDTRFVREGERKVFYELPVV